MQLCFRCLLGRLRRRSLRRLPRGALLIPNPNPNPNPNPDPDPNPNPSPSPSPNPNQVRYFCFSAGMIIFVLFLLTSTFFLALLTLDEG